MSYFNNSKFGQEREPFKKSPFNEDFDEDSLIPPPGSEFMVEEGTNIVMQEEGLGPLMITEAA